MKNSTKILPAFLTPASFICTRLQLQSAFSSACRKLKKNGMKKLVLFFLIFSPCCLFAQIGLKTGLNFANVSGASSINSSSRSGFIAGIFLAPKSTGILGFRTELIYSKQGYNYKSNTNTGHVDLDYILLPQLTTISITKYFQLQLGAQMAFLINAKADSTSGTSSSGYGSAGKLLSFYNKFDYGLAGGVEIHPYKGILIGARYNISLGNLYNTTDTTGTNPSFIPKVNAKNNVVNIFIGWRFGK